MDANQLKNHIDARLDGLELKLDKMGDKMDNHMERITKSEAAVQWISGHIKLVYTIILSVSGFVLAAAYELLIKK